MHQLFECSCNTYAEVQLIWKSPESTTYYYYPCLLYSLFYCPNLIKTRQAHRVLINFFKHKYSFIFKYKNKSNLIWFISKWSHFSGQLNILHTFLLTAIFTPLKLVVPQTALCKLIKWKFGCFVNLEPIQKMQIKTQPRLPIMCLMKHNVQRIELTLITANFIKKNDYGVISFSMYGQRPMKHNRDTNILK